MNSTSAAETSTHARFPESIWNLSVLHRKGLAVPGGTVRTSCFQGVSGSCCLGYVRGPDRTRSPRTNRSTDVRRHGAWSASSPSGGTRRDEGVEQALLVGVVLGGVLRVPLHAEDPAAGQLDGLDRAVLGPAGHDEAVAEPVDRLVVHRVADRGLLADGDRGQRAGRQAHLVVDEPVLVDVLHQRAAERDVEHLVAAADGEQREAELDRRPGHGQVERIVVGIDLADPGVDLRRAVAVRVDVGSAGQADPVEAGQRPARSARVASIGGSTTGCPPARTMASWYVRPSAVAGTRHVSARSVARDDSAMRGRTRSTIPALRRPDP